jgi:hypothetical protein
MSICLITNNPNEIADQYKKSRRTCETADPFRLKERGC